MGSSKDPSHVEMSPQILRLPYTTDGGMGGRARLGVLVLQTDQTIEAEFGQLLDLEGVAIYHARLANDAIVTPNTLTKMADELPTAASLLPPNFGFDAIAYGCTSGATLIGEHRVRQLINDVHPQVPVTNPITAAKCALKILGVKNVALLTPYAPDVTSAMQANLEAAGIAVSIVGSFYEDNDDVVGQIDESSILAATLSIGASKACDGVFISCTSLRATGIIERAENQLGKPVTASNHALAWHLLRLAGIQDTLAGKGRLFAASLT